MDDLKALREATGLTQARLADLVGTSQPQIKRLESGERELTRSWAERLAPHLKTTAIRILFPEVPPPPAEKVEGEVAVKALLRQIDKLPEGALQPLWRSIDGYIKDGERSEQSRSQARPEASTRRHERAPTR